ncbi:MAG TPA: hypothetical protein VGF76_21910 [Polyangiaceae bacterium]
MSANLGDAGEPRAGGGSSSGGGGQAALGSDTPSVGGEDAAGDGGQAGGPPTFVDGCPDLDGDGVSDCTETAVKNSTFDADVSSWASESGATIAWNAKDLLDQAGSGSALVTSTGSIDAAGDSFVAANQCIPVSDGQVVDLVANTYIDAGQVTGRASISLWFFPVADCPGDSSPDVFETSAVFATEKVQTLRGRKAVPAGMLSLRVRLGVIKPFQAETFSVHFDSVLVHAY